MDVNDTASVNNSSENNTSGSIQGPKINGSKLNITGPKLPMDGPKIESPFPYNLRDNPKYKSCIDEWTEPFANLLKYMSFEDACSELIHEFFMYYMWDEDDVYHDFENNIRDYLGVIFLVVNEHKSLKNQMPFDMIAGIFIMHYGEWK